MQELNKAFVHSLIVLISSGIACYPDSNYSQKSTEKDNQKAFIADELATNTLLLKKYEKSDVEGLSFDQAIIKYCRYEDKIETCLCKAAAFRVAQLCCLFSGDTVFKSYQVEKIVTGWNADGPKGIFVKKLGVPADRFFIASDSTPTNDLTLENSWYEINFKNGEKITFKGTARIYTEKYLELRSKFKNGDQSVKKEFEEEKRKVEDNLRELPFKDKFIINYYGVKW